MLGVSVCGGGESEAERAPENEIAVEQAPEYYPAEHGKIIEGAKAEGGSLTIYSNADQENWAPGIPGTSRLGR
ncbi:hypothetical protein [Kineosporia babensis]|uniref:Uncharacterized protein n=1 Tax=Kineosporia babensis TaxID=499548 RepID=A0A9X1NJ18_9ACTN|nr:hypothetical protein [Kineosporia babensis]MCD5314106.1 hypothetical protein [Kineosporia babensis]